MEATPRPTPGLRTYEAFEPSFEWVRDEKSETLLVKLPGFKKEQIKVQINNYRVLTTSGERPLNGNRWRNFHKVFRIPENLNTKEIRAKFENGILYVILPKLITRADPQDQPSRAPEPPTKSKPGGVRHETTQKADTRASGESEATARKREDGKSSEPWEAKKGTPMMKEKEKVRPEEPAGTTKVGGGEKGGEGADARKKEPSAREQVSADGGSTRKVDGGEKGGERVDARKKEPSAREQVSSDGGSTGIGSWPEKARYGVGRLVVGLRKPRRLLLDVAVAMVLVGLGMYLAYKVRKATVAESN